MNNMTITNAQYCQTLMVKSNISQVAPLDGKEMFVPLDPANSDYAEIMRQVAAGELTIADAD